MFCPAGTATAVVDWPAEPDHQNHDSTFIANASDPDSTAMRGAVRLLMHTALLSVELHTSLGYPAALGRLAGYIARNEMRL
jgi:hypothetical protein